MGSLTYLHYFICILAAFGHRLIVGVVVQKITLTVNILFNSSVRYLAHYSLTGAATTW